VVKFLLAGDFLIRHGYLNSVIPAIPAGVTCYQTFVDSYGYEVRMEKTPFDSNMLLIKYDVIILLSWQS